MQHSFNGRQHPKRVPLDFAYRGGLLLAGSYRYADIRLPEQQSQLLRVRLADEITLAADVTVPVLDFGVPPKDRFLQALEQTARHLLKGRPVFVGCGYGIGRTGTFLAALYKLNRDVLWLTRGSRTLGDDANCDPVQEVRDHYHPHAVETAEQEYFVRSLDYAPLARRLALRIKPWVVLDKRFWLR